MEFSLVADLPIPAIQQFLLHVSPKNLHLVCCLNKKIAGVCSSSTFVKEYAKKYEDELNSSLVKNIERGNDFFYKKWYKSTTWDPSVDNNFVIKCSSQKGYVEIVKLLLDDPRVDPSAQNNFAIGLASENGHTDIVKLLLADPRVNPSADNNYAIRRASREGHTLIVKLLLADPRVDPSANDNYAIKYASQKGHTEIVRLLNDKCASKEQKI